VTELTQDDFARLMIDRIQRAGEKGRLSYQRDEFRIRGEGERSAALMLGNAFKEYCAAEEAERERVLKHWVRNWFNLLRDMPEEFEDVKPDLLPIVRSRSHFELNQLRGLAESGTPISWPYVPLGEHFGVALVYDLPDAMRSVPQANLDTWGLTLYEALEIACQNLAELPAKFIGPQSGDGVYLSATGDNYDASRILSRELIDQFQVAGDPVAMIPNRDTLIVAGADDEAGLDAMAKMAAKALEQLRPISSVAVRYDGNDWVPWMPEAGHPLYKQFRRFFFDTLGRDYAEQKELLDKLHARTNKNYFVATYDVVQDPQGRLSSYMVWTERVESLLPQTDLIVFGSMDGDPAMVPWSKAMDVVGHFLESLDIYPPRYRVREFPTAAQLAAMGSVI
jgi:uncharacterized protein YtpQ (UPF0354 family)